MTKPRESDRVGVPGQQRRSGGRRVPSPRRRGGQPAVHAKQPAEREDRVDRVGHRELAVEQRRGQQRRHHGHAVRSRPVQPEPPPGQVGQRQHRRADRRVDHQCGPVHGDRVVREPVHRHDQQRVAGRVERRVGEVGRDAAREDPRRDQVRLLVGRGQRHRLHPAERARNPAGTSQPNTSSRPDRHTWGVALRGPGHRWCQVARADPARDVSRTHHSQPA